MHVHSPYYVAKYHHSIPKNITSLVPSVLLRVYSKSQQQQTCDILFGITWYYGDNDFIMRTFDFIAHSDAARVTCSADVVSHSSSQSSDTIGQYLIHKYICICTVAITMLYM